VDSTTGTVNVETVFANPNNILRPGLFVRVTIPVREEKGALLVPQQSLVEVQGSYHISIVLDDNTIQPIPVQKGEQQGRNIIVTSEHLKAGMRVVVNGAEKVRSKMKVQITPHEPVVPATPSIPSIPSIPSPPSPPTTDIRHPTSDIK